MVGIVHFANYLRYMEQAEHAFLRSIGYSVCHMENGVRYGWPRISVSCDYRQPLRFEETIEIQLLVKEKRSRSVSYLHLFWKTGTGEPQLAAVGQMVVVCVALSPVSGVFTQAPPPPGLMEKIEEAPGELYAGHLKNGVG